MKLSKLLILIAAFAVALCGCGKKEEVSTVTEVDNPPAMEKNIVSVQPEPGPDGYVVSETGLKYKDITVGKGDEASGGNMVVVHYRGWLNSGKVFDTSKQPGREPFSFTVGMNQVIPGWEEGIQGMRVGGTRQLIIPPQLGYGSEDMGDIPPNSTLNFEVELLEIR